MLDVSKKSKQVGISWLDKLEAIDVSALAKDLFGAAIHMAMSDDVRSRSCRGWFYCLLVANIVSVVNMLFVGFFDAGQTHPRSAPSCPASCLLKSPNNLPASSAERVGCVASDVSL